MILNNNTTIMTIEMFTNCTCLLEFNLYFINYTNYFKSAFKSKS